MRDRATQELAHQAVHGLVEGGREEQPLTGGRRLREQPAHARQEAEVGHVVGLVEHGDLDVGEAGVTLADEVLEPARAGQHDVGGLQTADLRVLADAAEHGLGGEPGGRRERREGGLDLADQLTGRSQDQRTRCAGADPARVGLEAGDERKQEGVGLARAGAAAAEDVTTREGVGQGRGLDRGGLGDGQAGQDGRELRGHAEVGK